jgi:hypothetical protein
VTIDKLVRVSKIQIASPEKLEITAMWYRLDKISYIFTVTGL